MRFSDSAAMWYMRNRDEFSPSLDAVTHLLAKPELPSFFSHPRSCIMHVYLGRLNWLSSVDNECITVVFPGGLGLQDPVCAYWQWSMSTTIDQGVNDCQYGLIKTVTKTSTQYMITFAGQDYLVDAEFSANLTSMTMKMYVADGLVEPSSVSKLQKQMSTPSLVPSTKVFTGKINWSRFAINEMVTLVVPNGVADSAKTDWRQLHRKKALIVRYGTGTDNGIFLLRDMLTTGLGFDAVDVDMVYYHHEPADSIAVIPFGQQAPTAANFKAKLTSFLSSAETGDVRFLYLDTLGETGPAGTADEKKGIVLAANDEGRERETVYNEWLATVIHRSQSHHPYLILLGLEDVGLNHATGGILLSAYHETQSNIKALQVNGSNVDPWLYTIIAVIKKQIKDRGSIPTYSSLFNGAKKFLKTPFASSHIVDDKYMGPSANELSPTGRNWGQSTSNQDPQLIFFGQSNPLEEKFLCPLVSSPRVGQTGSDWVTRFPRDEYPTSCTL
ncbi:hypothetical protein K523DRAFT_354837 [Schizophyllum commune Tattone D]|nr:hypothetical protein K523DRAFT_354837 [Schizophyllum commune Tattone D]